MKKSRGKADATRTPRSSAAGEELGRLLRQEPILTVAVAESVTCGRVQAAIGAVSGASDYFLGGVTAYSAAAKARLLRVNKAAAHRANSVSPEIAAQMAKGVCALFKSDIGVSTTGYAEPLESRQVDVPHAYWALATRDGRGRLRVARHGRIECPHAGRIEAQAIIAEAVLAELVVCIRAKRQVRSSATKLTGVFGHPTVCT